MPLCEISVSGLNGFVGKNISSLLNNSFQFKKINFNCIQLNNSDIVLHLAGKAHDFRNKSDFDEYYKVNYELTRELFDAFLASKARVFITLSSVKAVADKVEGELKEDITPNPITNYGKSKLLAEQYILSKPIPEGKRVFILRPCMIHGPGNKGNLSLLYHFVSKGLPWPLGLYNNSRSYLSIDNLCFIIKELIEREDIQSGVYHVADDITISTNEIIEMIAELKGKKVKILRLSKNLINVIARFGDILKLPFNSERLQKLTENYVVSNAKIKEALGKHLPISAKEGLFKTFITFERNA
jgi:nucleoside-diphosphate-sugar epimerase